MPREPLYNMLCRDVLGLARTEEFQPIALEALDHDCDSPSLRVLAVLIPGEFYQSRERFYAVVSEFGWAIPTKDEAVLVLVRDVAQRIVDHAMPPIEGAKRIERLVFCGDAVPYDIELYCSILHIVHDLLEWCTDDEWNARDIRAAAHELLEQTNVAFPYEG